MASEIQVRPRKRLRVDSPPSNSSEPGAEVDEEYVYVNGTITLQCAGGGQLVAPMNFLADRSPVFRDMLALPQPRPSDSETESSDELPLHPPLVELPDVLEDVFDLLRVLVLAEGSAKLFSSHIHPTFDTISACVRLGHKYQIDHVVKDGMDYLRNYFPRNLDAYRELLTPAVPPEFEPFHAIGVVNLARLTGADEILPTAIMKCSALPGSQLLAGFKRRDGSFETLEPEDLALCFDAKGTLMQDYAQRSAALAQRIPSHNSTQPGEALNPDCRRAAEAVAKGLERQAGKLTTGNVLDGLDWKPLVERRDGVGGQVCVHCVRTLEKRERKYLQETWDRLPELVGVRAKD